MTPNPERLRELLARARRLPWTTGEGDPESILCASDYACVAQANTAFSDAADNAALIVAAVNALPALLHQLAEQRKLLKRCEAALRISECDMQYHDEQGVRRSLQQTIAAFLAASGGKAQ